jgi:Ion channel
MAILITILGVALIWIILWDAFETIVLPRRVTRKVRLTRLFYRCTWQAWAAGSCLLAAGKRREAYLSVFGPLSLLLLLSIWAVGLVSAFACLHWGLGSALHAPEEVIGFGTEMYLSGTTFFTLGLGDITPRDPLARTLLVVEAGVGFGFLALVIGYLPVIYQAFSRREASIVLLDARAGSPPTAAELLRRHSHANGLEALQQLLHEWERWAAELLESHLSYPVLAYFHSQHDNQSWLAALTTILDTSALLIVGVEGACQRQAELTFAMARHAVVDLAQIFSAPTRQSAPDRLSAAEFASLRTTLVAAGLQLRTGNAAEQQLAALRRMYEPCVASMAGYLGFTMPAWITDTNGRDNWQTSAWEQNPPLPGHGILP